MAVKLPVSVKGVLLVGGKVVLVRNERGEWELPAGYARSIQSWSMHAES